MGALLNLGFFGWFTEETVIDRSRVDGHRVIILCVLERRSPNGSKSLEVFSHFHTFLHAAKPSLNELVTLCLSEDLLKGTLAIVLSQSQRPAAQCCVRDRRSGSPDGGTSMWEQISRLDLDRTFSFFFNHTPLDTASSKDMP